MRPYGTAQQLEKRRRQAIGLLRAGKNLSAVARALSASVSSVFRWFQTYREKGSGGLRPKPTPGRPPRLSKSREEPIGKVAPEGSPGRRLSDRPMDLEPDSQSDRPGVWGSISPLPRLEASIKPGMELSETRASSLAKGRRRDCPLEALPLAPYKKNRKTWGPSGLPR